MLKKISFITLINLIAQVISLIGFTITAKFYGLSNIGGLLVVSSYAGIISIASTGYLEQLFFIEKRENIRKLSFVLIFYILLIVLLVSLVFLCFFSISYVVFILLNVLSSGLIKLISTYNISENKILFVSYSKLIFAPLISTISYLVYLFYGPSEFYLVFIYSICNLCFSLVFALISLNQKSIYFSISDLKKIRSMKAIQQRYFNFVKFSLPGEFLRTAAFKAPTIVLEKFFGKEIAGLYGIANQILILPITIVIGAISQVYIQKLSSIIKNRKLSYDTSLKFLLPIIGVSSLVVILFYFLGEFFLDLVFSGEGFSTLYSVVLLLLPYAFSILIASPFLTIFTIIEKQNYLFNMKLIIFIISIVSFSISIFLDDFKLGLMIFSFNLFTIYSIFTLIAFRQLKK